MIILGIDPGYGLVGYGVIEKTSSKIKMLDYGAIDTPKNITFSKRLNVIYKCIQKLIETYKPDCVAIEELFFGRNITTAIRVAEARGVILLAVENCHLPVFEYKPNEIKLALTGMGQANKSQMEFMVKTILGLEKKPKPDDAADALAVAICHSQTNQAMKGNFGGAKIIGCI